MKSIMANNIANGAKNDNPIFAECLSILELQLYSLINDLGSV